MILPHQLAGRSMTEYLEARIRELEDKLYSAVQDMLIKDNRIRELVAALEQAKQENARLREALESLRHIPDITVDTDMLPKNNKWAIWYHDQMSRIHSIVVSALDANDTPQV